MERRGLAVEITVDNRIVTNHLSSEVGGAKRIYQQLLHALGRNVWFVPLVRQMVMPASSILCGLIEKQIGCPPFVLLSKRNLLPSVPNASAQ